MSEYNGWKNKATWNVALWLQNDEPIYNAIQDYAKRMVADKTELDYQHFIACYGLKRTPDNIGYIHPMIDVNRLTDLLYEMTGVKR